MTAGVKHSQFQLNIFDAVLNKQEPIAVNAVAGSGKSFTLVEAVRRGPAPALVVAFNKHVAEELKRRLAGRDDLTVSTLHALGYKAIRDACDQKTSVVGPKYMDITTWALGQFPKCWEGLYESAFEARYPLRQLAEFARLSLVDPTDERFPHAAALYALECPPPFVPVVKAILDEGASEARHDGVIDFTDMLWLVHRWSLQVDKYPCVYVDEVQDLNPAQLALVLRSRATGARGLLVGDPSQSIFGFAFAGLDAFEEARDAVGAQELPLSICYRCPTTHLDLARELVPHILPRDDAPPGIIEHCFDNEVVSRTQPGDMMLCRNTAPLIRQAIQFIRARVPAWVKGRDIGESILKTIEVMRKRTGGNIAGFDFELYTYAAEQHERLRKRHAPATVHTALDDRVDCALAVYETAATQDWETLIATVNRLCADRGAGVCLSTVHRAKGLEADRVWILRPELLERSRDPQSRNAKYVALTRSREFLGFVHATNPV